MRQQFALSEVQQELQMRMEVQASCLGMSFHFFRQNHFLPRFATLSKLSAPILPLCSKSLPISELSKTPADLATPSWSPRPLDAEPGLLVRFSMFISSKVLKYLAYQVFSICFTQSKLQPKQNGPYF